VKQQRRLVFGDVAELYERVRPTYPERLIDDVLALSGADRALEVGAGTGKATRLFAARGVAVRAVEPSPAMAALAREACAGYADVTIEERDFEQFDPGGERFRLLFSAQAWHWISPDVRYVKARQALEPAGLLAVFWNRPHWGDSPLRADLLEVYRRAGAALDPDAGLDPMHPASDMTPKPQAWEREIAAAGGFERPEMRLYDWSWTYSTSDYLELLRTHSGHIVRPEAEREAILDGVREVIESGGGSLRMPLVTELCLARAA
jgi:SAM-dependent methyltransferase